MTLLRNSPLASAAVALCCRPIASTRFNLHSNRNCANGTGQLESEKESDTNCRNQANAQSDRMTAAKIRKTIIADKTLSTYAHNIKINSLAQLPRIPYCAVPSRA
jgi:hyperosmotically inducible periplasmic protein